MRKYLLLPTLVLLLAACANDEPKNEPTKDKPALEKSSEKEKPAAKETEPTEEVVSDKEINTSIYEYASKVDVTDARELNDHITLMIDMKTDNENLAFQHVLYQTYDFLQQKDIEGAKTIGVNVRVAGKKIVMFTVYPEKFVPNNKARMSDVVLAASEIEMMSKKVEKYGKKMGTW
ncbi:hypothetical protein M3197_14555 [Sporosarcina aquimarina]|uniref:hypothetical protein n=1 Tax=Sporosarcina aquimarina TaxID=114975 RepID=UPI00204050C7|nr:hypothetical protein [Sporosarcina aquimarina]MCM3758683.1 hypothetical protein [Sporosarcina aquimarina]